MAYDFGTKGRASNNEKTPMAPGHVVKAKLVKAEVDKDGHLYFHFKNDTGVFRHKEFAIDPAHPDFKPEWADKTMERINHIACALAPKEKVEAIPGNVPFASWAGQLTALINAVAVDLEVELHLVIYKNYLSFPLYINFISSELAKCSWVSNSQYHKYEYVEVEADAEASADPRDGEETDAEGDETF